MSLNLVAIVIIFSLIVVVFYVNKRRREVRRKKELNESLKFVEWLKVLEDVNVKIESAKFPKIKKN